MDESPGKMYALASVMLVLACVPVALRFYVRSKQKQGLCVDDWLILPALLGTIGTAATMYDATALGGLGGHTQIAPDGFPIFTEATMIYLKANFVSLLTQTFTFGFTKLSVLFFYRRLFSGKAYFNIASWTLVGLVSAWTIAFFFGQLCQCVPIEANWLGPDAGNAVCIDELKLYLIGAWSDAIMDAIILALPLPIIWNLQMSAGRKCALTGVFLLGALTVMSSVARLVVYYNIDAQLSAGAKDMAWILAPTFYWALIESSLGILGACLPPLRPLFKGFSPETVLRSLRGVMTIDSSSRGSRSRASAPVDPEKREWVGSPMPISTIRETFSPRRTADNETWSFHSDAESFGYWAGVNANGVAVKRYEMV